MAKHPLLEYLSNNYYPSCHGFDICSPNAMPVWINVAPEKSFQSIRSLSTQPSSQHPLHVHLFRDTCIELVPESKE